MEVSCQRSGETLLYISLVLVTPLMRATRKDGDHAVTALGYWMSLGLGSTLSPGSVEQGMLPT